MPNEIDTAMDEIFAGKRIEKGPYKPKKGEEAIFAAPEKGLLDYLAPLLPFYRQFTGEIPWRDPETAMEAIGWGMGGLMRGPGMAKAVLPKGASSVSKALTKFFGGHPGTTEFTDEALRKAGITGDLNELIKSGQLVRGERGFRLPAEEKSSISKALEEIGSELFGKGGVPATIEKGPLPAAIERGFTRKAGETIETTGRVSRIPKKLETTERKQLPRAEGYPGQRTSYAGPTARQTIKQPRIEKDPIDILLERAGFPQPPVPTTWRERTFPGSIKRAQDVIESLFRESLRAKGMID